ncbi:hypothetical protein B0T16DRAFT_60513 [Cercophora newfieldiana]|uniref:Uncharacterized protein n=1 Tax=Cercophora newfieldiana TaxID=92897 RepID=A0AA39YRS1_9PEZI|nr:hypothetical protein B0T16DRAFT_60513 [Cercophora newfieldiana]
MAPRPPSSPRLFSRLSHASSEADDERSSIGSADIPSRMSPDRSSSGGRSRSSANSGRRINPGGNGNGNGNGGSSFAHEDTRPTSSKELAGFYAYSFAAEVYVVCGQ